VLEVDDHDHAKQSLVEFDSEFEVHHAVTDPATGKICLYFTDRPHMTQAARRIGGAADSRDCCTDVIRELRCTSTPEPI